MTDAAMPVTGRAVEQFTEAYLRSLGADIQKKERQWRVSIPDGVDTELDLNGAVLEIASDLCEVSDDALAIAPESPFVERMIDEAADRTPVGSVALTGEHCGVQLPPWIVDGPVKVAEQTFTPYYDRRALCALFHVGIETVSEYQSEELRAVAIDFADQEERPRLADTYLELTDAYVREQFPEGTLTDGQQLTKVLDVARTSVKDEIAPVIQDTRERANRAAEGELAEYRQFVHQQRDELNDEIDRTTERIEEVNATIDRASAQVERVNALRRRKQLRSELDDLRSEVVDLTTQIEAGFVEKRNEIRDRHSLTVRIHPVTATTISYERGDLTLTLRTEDVSNTVSYAYAIGTGVIDNPCCERCERELAEDNPLTLDTAQVIGSVCCGND